MTKTMQSFMAVAIAASMLLFAGCPEQQRVMRDPAQPAPPTPAIRPDVDPDRPDIDPDRPEVERPAVEDPERDALYRPDAALHDEQALVTWLTADNRLEIELSRLAQQQAQSQQVRQFAQHMVQDHSQFVQDLQQAAGEERQNQQVEPGAARQPEGQVDLLHLKQELGQRHIQSLSELLRGKEGLDFDHTFMHMQVTAHVKMIDTLEAFSDHATGELRQAMQQGLETTREHLQQARQILTQVEQQMQLGSEPGVQPEQPGIEPEQPGIEPEEPVEPLDPQPETPAVQPGNGVIR